MFWIIPCRCWMATPSAAAVSSLLSLNLACILPCSQVRYTRWMIHPRQPNQFFEGIRYIRTSERKGLAGIAIQKRIPILRELAVISRLRKKVVSILRSETFDIVHAHSPALCGLAASLAARSCNVPFVYEIRAFWEDGAVDQNRDKETSLRYRISKNLETNVAHRADAVVGIARPILDDLEGRGVQPAKLFRVPNGVDVARFSPRPRDASLAAELGVDGVRTLGFLGTLFLWEGIAWLISAAQELHKRGVVFKLLDRRGWPGCGECEERDPEGWRPKLYLFPRPRPQRSG